MTIDEIFQIGNMSVRSYNICKGNKLDTVIELKEYFYEHKSFYKLRNCGRRTNEELLEICNEPCDISYEVNHEVNYEANFEEEKIAEPLNPLIKIISLLSRTQKDVINSFILVNTNSLTVRNQNAIQFFLKDDLKIKNFANNILLFKNFQINKIKNVGRGSIPELENYIQGIISFLIKVSENENEKQLISLKNNFLIQSTYSVSKIPKEILESESIFRLINFLIDQNALFDKNQTKILQKTFNIYQDSKELTLDEIADEMGLTRERVRQIRVKFSVELLDKLLFMQNFNDDLFQKYNIDVEQNFIDVNEELVEIINNYNETNFSNKFITYLLYAYLLNKFSLVGNQDDVFFPKHFSTRNRHNWINFYLVKKQLVTSFDFISFTDDISRRIDEKIEETYNFNFKSYISKFLINNNIEILDLAFPIAEKIVNDEFELYLDLEENIIFKRNTNKQAYEYTYEALDQLGKPSKVKEIFKKVIELHPNYDTEIGKIRVSMKRKNGFVPIGRKSVFGLKKWEDELDNFKGGTIRDIVAEYLSQSTTPTHITVITNHVLKYRPKSNQTSILQNLKLDESGLYIFFKGSQIGLSTNNYNEKFIKVISNNKGPILTWTESLNEINQFIEKENRLPYSSGCSNNEKKLYRWYNIQKRKYDNSKLPIEKEKLISDIDQKFHQTNGKRRSISETKYSELIAFVKTNFRLPFAKKNGEEILYKFFYKQRILFDRKELGTEEEIKFIEVAKFLQNIQYENKRN